MACRYALKNIDSEFFKWILGTSDSQIWFWFWWKQDYFSHTVRVFWWKISQAWHWTLNYVIYIHGIQSDYFFILNSNASFMHSFTNFKHAIVSFTCNCELNMLQGVPRELTKSISLLHRPGSIPGPIIRGEKFTDARTFWYSMVTINTNDFLNCFFIWLQFH